MSTSSENLTPSVDANEAINKQSDNIKNLTEISKNSRTTFFAILLAVAYSYLTIGATTDAALFSISGASSPLPIIQTQVHIVLFYKFAPILLFLLFIYFHLYLQRFWRCVATLPLHHDDGRSLDDYIYPWIISSAFLHVEISELNKKNKYRFLFEAAISIFLAWWLIPFMLLFFWARYLPAHDWTGTSLHIVIFVLSVTATIYFYYAAKDAVNNHQSRLKSGNCLLHPTALTLYGTVFSLIALTYSSYGAIEGAPKKMCQSSTISRCSLLYSGARLLEFTGFSPFADFSGSKFEKPDNWWKLLESDKFKQQISDLKGLNFSGKNLRFANAKQAFLIRSDFSYTEMQWINLEETILIEANFTHAKLDNALLNNADLRWANLTETNFNEANLSQANLGNSSLKNTRFTYSQMNGVNFHHSVGLDVYFIDVDLRLANFTSAQFPGVKMINTKLQEAIFLQAQLENSYFENVTFQKANLTSIKLSGSYFKQVGLQKANLSDSVLSNASFEDTDFEGTRLNNAFIDGATFLKSNFRDSNLSSVYAYKTKFTNINFSLAILDYADFREAVFTKSDLTDASINNANLSNTVFNNSRLIRTNFGNSELYGAVFKNSDLSGAILSNTKGFDLANIEGS